MPQEQTPQVQVDDPGGLNLVGLILRELVNQNLQKPKVARKVKKMNLVMEIKAGKMFVTLRAQNGVVSMHNGSAPDVHLKVRGSMNDFLSLGVLEIPWQGLLRLRLWASGRIYKLPAAISLLLV